MSHESTDHNPWTYRSMIFSRADFNYDIPTTVQAYFIDCP